MSDPGKTYSGAQSYHEMLMRAQAQSPALTYAMCTLLLAIKIKPETVIQQSEEICLAGGTSPICLYFHREPQHSKMHRFLEDVFRHYTVWIISTDVYGNQKALCADTQFVQWLQAGAVTIDNERQLVTVKC